MTPSTQHSRPAPGGPGARHTLRMLAMLTGLAPLASGWRSAANPAGLSVAAGSVSASYGGPNLNLAVSQNAVLDWKSFNIAAGETTTFQQPSARSVVWNRIADQNPSQIFGNLNANGFVVLMNQSGFYFGPNSVINVGGFLATTAPVTPPGVGGGPLWQFNGAPPAASIINYGQIQTSAGGSLFLVAEKIENHGVLMAPDGTLGLYAGKQVLLSDSPDGRGLSVQVTLPQGSIDNTGKLIADAGTIALHAQVVNQNGLIQANSVREHNGVIELIASDAATLGPASSIQANGDASGASAGGQVTIKSAGAFADDPASQISVAGGVRGGNGGAVEVSATAMASVDSQILGQAQSGWAGGSLLIDPTDIVIGRSSTPNKLPAGGVLGSTKFPGTSYRLNASTSFRGFANITLQATRDISLDPQTQWSLASIVDSATGLPKSCQLTLEAGRNIIFGNGSQISGGAGWSVSLAAGADFTAPLHVPDGATTGGIYLNGAVPTATTRLNFSGTVQTTDGNITMAAGKEILLGGGAIRTTGGGNISLTTRSGNVEAGNNANWLSFTSYFQGPDFTVPYVTNPSGVGGIATIAGGNVTIQAGGDLKSIIPVVGAYGNGNVSLSAGGLIQGNFLVRNGAGTLNSQTDIGSSSSPVTLELVSGSWHANAARDIYVNEVLNPNGMFNSNPVLDPATGNQLWVPFQFDYAPDATVVLNGGNSVQLLGSALQRSRENRDLPVVYPPILDVQAGPGGIILGNNVVLYPSPQSDLALQTTGGGDLASAPGKSCQIVMSDSSSPRYTTFVTGHSAVPLQEANAGQPVRVDISGDLQNVSLQIPKAADIQVGGNTLNFFYTGQNLTPDNVTTIRVAGDVQNRSPLTQLTMAGDPNLTILNDLYFAGPNGLAQALSYDPATRLLTFRGRMSSTQRDYLLNPVIYTYDYSGERIVDQSGMPITVAAAPFADAATINQLYQSTQDVPLAPPAGFIFGGPGKVNFSARNLDLGITMGIRSVAGALNPALGVALGPDGTPMAAQGADLNLTVGYANGDPAAAPIAGAGNLNIGSSQIASFSGGSINLQSAGQLNVGSQTQLTSDSTPRGIYTGHGGDVTVESLGDILLNGSRIGTYDGGNVTVISRDGLVDAGNGGKGFFNLITRQYNPATGQVEDRTDEFFGSGIVAMTRQDSTAPVGNITVQAHGDILANSGGVLQLAFNKSDIHNSVVDLVSQTGSIEANESGILGANVQLKAAKDITGLVVANQNISIQANQNVAVTALAGNRVGINAGGNFAGTAVGGGDVAVSGLSVSGTALSTHGSTSTGGDASGAKTTAFSGVAAPVAKQVTTDNDKPLAGAQTDPLDNPDDKKKKPQLARTVGRVTVILPNKT